MNKIIKHSARDLTYRFQGPEFMPADEDECLPRDAQWKRSRQWRPLRAPEIDVLMQQGNVNPDWSNVRVTARFNPKLVRGCRFDGFVRIADLEPLVLEFEGLRLPAGLYHSVIIACDIGANAAIHNVGHLANTLVGDEAMLFNVGMVLTRPGARFGAGIIHEGESEEQRAWLEVGNECGGRHIAPFEGMLAADAWLWAKRRDDQALMDSLREMTDIRRPKGGVQYGMIGDRTVIRNARTLIDVTIGSDALIDGAGRLENLTIRSDDKEGTRVGENSDLSDGIVGYGCQVGQGVKAARFVLGDRAKLQLGARVLHSFIGDNSTVACCEVVSSLVFPGHEQHHNNSFLIAATLQGQSNVAAGATIGSNHNSRAADGEIVAGRGFWPGLCTSFKHPSRFAAYTLVAKGDYAYELDIRLPFSLVSNNERLEQLQIAPAWWFLHNMYAVMRNGWKFRARDTRQHPGQHIEYDALAPDTVEEMLAAATRLEELTAAAALLKEGHDPEDLAPEARRAMGRQLLQDAPAAAAELEILDPEAENSRRKARLFKAPAAWAIYREMAHHYAVSALVDYMEARRMEELDAAAAALADGAERRWVNMGGQIVPLADMQRLIERITTGEFLAWEEVHQEYDRLWAQYPEAKARHAFAVLLELSGKEAGAVGGEDWAEWLERAQAIRAMIVERTCASRVKDFSGAARRMTFDSSEEMAAVAGTMEGDSFIARVREQAGAFNEKIAHLLERNGLAAGQSA